MSKKVLLVEDDANYRLSLKYLLRGQPYEFIEAGSPEEGISLLAGDPQIHVILLDLSFERGKATELLAYVNVHADDYRVIVLTAHDELLLAEQAREYAVFNYLPKAQTSSKQSIRFSVEQAFKDLERTYLDRKVRFLLDLQRRVTAGAETEETLDSICQSVLSTVGAYTCHIRIYDFKKGDYHLKGFAGADPKMRRLFEKPKAKGDLFSGKVVESGEPQIFEDLQSLALFQNFKAAALADTSIAPEERTYWDIVQSAYIAPISTGLFEKGVDAVLNVSSDYRNFFAAEKRAAVEEYVTLAALAVAKDWLQRKRQEIHQDYSEIGGMLGEISARLRGPEVLKGIYEVVTKRISRIINAEVVSIFLYNDGTGFVENVAELRGDELLDVPSEVYWPGQSLTGSVYASNQTIHLPKPGDEQGVKPLEDSRFDHANKDMYLHDTPSARIEHYLGVPIRIGGKKRGVLRAINKKSEYYAELGHHDPLCLLGRGFSEDCRNIMEITASHLGVAISNAELIREKEHQVEQIRSLGDVGRFINSRLDIEEVLKLAIEEMAEVMQSQICMLFLKDPDRSRITLRQCSGIPMIQGASYEIGEGVTGAVAETGVPRLIVNAEENNGKYDEQIRRSLAARHGHPIPIDSLMVVPIITKGTVLGAMKVINKKGDHRRYSESDLRFFQTFGDYVGVAIENAQIYKVTNDRLAVAERNSALSQLVTAVAHEINNTSGVIPANVAAIKAALGPNEKISRMLAVIEDAASQATEFANEIAGFSARRKGEKRALDINEVIRHWIDELMAHVRRDRRWNKIEIKLSLCDGQLMCEIYRRPFIQIVRNIIINSFQALENRPSGLVRIWTYSGAAEFQSKAIIQIEDNGPGIPQENQKRIFDPSFTTKPRGNGVGLWLVKTQLEQIDGEIEVVSKPDEGTKFVVRIPISVPSKASAYGEIKAGSNC